MNDQGAAPDDPGAVLAAVAHEFKNALAPLGMTLQMIERQVKAGQAIVEDDLAFSRAQVRLLSGLVDDLLDQARVDLAALPFRPTAADVRAVVADAVGAFRRANPTPVVTDLPDVPLTASLDPTRMRQVLANLLESAARYAPAGSPVTVRVRRGPGAVARIEVCDRGPGLSPDEESRVFDRFVRGASAQGTSGLGLGLYLCRAIVDQHGGRIGVDTIPGSGCTFWIELRTS
ncbi:MAG TPA: HAMP domain-containing sensor histidine kinase [Polyangia bacterium]|nr:HAMP domain-containing sensor histidine kinase [Polyangia bacterium]